MADLLIVHWRELLMATPRLTSVDVAVGHALASFVNGTGECWPAVATVAAKAHCSERHARRSLRKLEALDLVVSDRGGGRHRTNRYRLNADTVSAFIGETRTQPTRNLDTVSAEGAQEGAHLSTARRSAPQRKRTRRQSGALPDLPTYTRPS
jgi:hypothetical protein